MDRESALESAGRYLRNAAHSRHGDVIFCEDVSEVEGWLVVDWGKPDVPRLAPEENIGYQPIIVNLTTGETRSADVNDMFLW
ncbi:hypothetical protein ACFYMW_40475 [Streptomyces sp. NPDC006692]|uniref:hypothetical protein n=1 Tax=Streptomyces sp. NPDC006692 TaxID=3364758 RepID=UPI00367E235E